VTRLPQQGRVRVREGGPLQVLARQVLEAQVQDDIQVLQIVLKDRQMVNYLDGIKGIHSDADYQETLIGPARVQFRINQPRYLLPPGVVQAVELVAVGGVVKVIDDDDSGLDV